MNTKTNFIYSILLIIVSCLVVNAQTTKDSVFYNELQNALLTRDGKFALVKKNYIFDPIQDSLFIYNNQKKQITTQKTNLNYKAFNNNTLVGYNANKKQLEVLDTNTLGVQIITDVSIPVIIEEYDLVFYLDTNTNSYRLIKITQSKIKEVWSNPKNLLHLSNISKDKQFLLIQYSELEKGIEILNLSNLNKTINKQTNYEVKQVVWDHKHPVVFLLPNTITNDSLPYLTFLNYKTGFSKKQDLNPEISYNSPEALNDHSFKIVQHSPLGKKPYSSEKLELWSTNDNHLNTIIASSKTDKRNTKGYVIFDFQKRKVYQPQKLNNQEIIILNQSLFLVYDSNQYLDYTYQWSSRPRDINLYNIENDQLSIIVEKQESPQSTTSLSPLGSYFVYTKNGELYFYNITTKTIENTFDLKNSSTKNNTLTKSWSSDEHFFYFTTQSDLMQYDTKRKIFTTLLEGNSKKVDYKILNSSYNGQYNVNNAIQYQSIANKQKLLVQKTNSNDNTTTLILIDNQKQTIIIDNTKDQITDIKYSQDFKTITYALENFNKPKTVFIYYDYKTKLLLENTMPKSSYSWKKQRVVSFKDKFGNNLKGILFYPKDYQPNQKYPMITRVYEMQNHLANRFTYSSFLNYEGFNSDLYLEQGYFVFYPDILTSEQGPGLSALNCVEEGIKEVLKAENSIDKDNLGLIGYSFGGYITNFIITQTNLFKTAVSGAGTSDIVASYFSYNEGYISPNYFKFENGQYNMPTSFKENKRLFLLNSPILYVDQIQTPLLTFTGKEDKVVDWQQQIELFTAMLRYNKQHVSLLYKGEGHGIKQITNQVDITKRILNWFDYFLKNSYNKQTHWVKYNTTFNSNKMTNN
ncbi:prolyl oligopeptidase family serine peptidase [Myroides pelagicus]|uniref:alpha/beta hydrolase family protein n=1 Tax=Myroides pelagicus TaxID=270914 RepID=UPI002DBAA96C|nr:prolyl oligopeptidase family serine peptidase [Myroides pelagicus]MEC4114969.1 prolyl oligopeptidase family serine peptidase [Myroides pelagicus]